MNRTLAKLTGLTMGHTIQKSTNDLTKPFVLLVALSESTYSLRTNQTDRFDSMVSTSMELPITLIWRKATQRHF